MTDAEIKLKKELEDLKTKFEADKRKLYKEYVESIRKFKVGDLLQQTQTGVTIAVKSIGVYHGMYGLPIPVYSGDKLTKKLLRTKKNEQDSIYGDDHVEHMGWDN